LAHDTLNNISSNVLNQVYSSLSSAEPSASSYSFDPLELISQTQTTSTQTANPTHSTGPTNNNVSPISKGAITGIVIGVLASIVIACLATYFLVRRRQKKQYELTPLAISEAEPKYTQPAQEYRERTGHMPQEMPGGNTRALELP
jgi:hypothetical protein